MEKVYGIGVSKVYRGNRVYKGNKGHKGDEIGNPYGLLSVVGKW